MKPQNIVKPLLFTVFFIVISAIVVPAKAFAATTYYVDCSAGSDSNSGTAIDAAWSSLAKANAASLTPGDSLLFKRGCTWNGTSGTVSLTAAWTGTEANPITIGAYGSSSDPNPIISYNAGGTNKNHTDINVTGSWQIFDHIDVNITNLTPDVRCTDDENGGNTPVGWWVGYNLTGSNNTVQYSTMTSLSLGVELKGTSNHILHNEIYDLHALWTALDPDGTSVAGGSLGSIGVNIHGTTNEVAYNYLHDNSAICNYTDPTDGLSKTTMYSAPFEVYNANGAYVHHNRAYGHKKHFEMGKDSSNTSSGNVLAYNLFASSRASARGPNIHGNDSFGPINNTYIYNNTILFTGSDSQALICSCSGNATIKNNIFVAESKAAFLAGTITEDHNLYWDYQQTSDSSADPFVQFYTGTVPNTIDATSHKTDPLLIDPMNATLTSGNFRPQSSSPARDLGTSISSGDSNVTTILSTDLDGTAVPQNSTPEIGAYEYSIPQATTNASTYAADTFTRVLPTSWGTADTGGNWSLSASSGNSHATDGSIATGILNACNSTNTESLNSVNQLNVDQTVKVKTNKASTGENQNIYMTTRKMAGNWEYRTNLIFNDGAVKLVAGKLQGSNTLVTISSLTVAGLTHSADEWFWFRTQIYGTNPTHYRVKVWPDSDTEPDTWNIDTTDSEATLQAAGTIGLRSFLPGTCTSAPLTISYDNYSAKSMNTPTLNSAFQYLSDCSTQISTGGFEDGSAMCIGGTVNDADNPDTLTLEAEVQPVGTAFTNTANYTSSDTASTGTAVTPTIDVTGLSTDTDYHWQARVVDSLGNASSWSSYGGNAESATDFTANAVPTIQFTSASSSGGESTTSVSLPVSLSAAAAQNVTVSYAVTGGTATGSGTDYTLASGTATITAGATSTTIPVTVVNDVVDEDSETIQVTLSGPSSNATLGANTVYTYTITDNDTAGVTLTPSGGITATEGGATGSYTVKLNTQPTSSVTVNVSVDAQVSTDKSSLTFTTGNWSTSQTVTITAVDDASAEGAHTGTVTHSATSSDGKYNGISISSKTVNITDNDAAGISIAESGGSTAVTEGGATDTYDVVLVTQPTNDVTITLTPDSAVSVDNNTLTFTNGNWSTPQTITVTAVNNSVADGTHTGSISHSAASSDGSYNGITIPTVNTTVTDNDTAGITVTESSAATNITEGGSTDTYTVVLTSQPTNDVTITLAHDSQVLTDASTLTFTSGNWSTPQTVTVTAVDDSVTEGNHTSTITHTASSSDSTYNGMSVTSVTANITDNDTAGVTVTESGGSTQITEAGATDTFTVVLTSQPTNDVIVQMDPDTLTAVDDSDSDTLTFTSANWDTAQTVTVSATDDFVDQGTTFTDAISFSIFSDDSNYSGYAVDDVTVTVTDNDTAGITVTETSGSTSVTEGGTTDTFDVVLQTQPMNAQPSGDVVIDLGTSSDFTISPSSLTFTTANWDTAQTVTVTAIDDGTEESTHTGSVVFTVSSADTIYDAETVNDVVITVVDNDGSNGGNSGNNNQSSNNSSSSSDGGGSSTSAPGPSICSDGKPGGTPYLFQIDRIGNKAILHFAPVPGPYNGYYVSYGAGAETEMYGGSMSIQNSPGVISFDVNALDPRSAYSFKVKALNGCTSGDFSNTVTIGGVNAKSRSATKFYPSLSTQILHPVRTSQQVGTAVRSAVGKFKPPTQSIPTVVAPPEPSQPKVVVTARPAPIQQSAPAPSTSSDTTFLGKVQNFFKSLFQ